MPASLRKAMIFAVIVAATSVTQMLIAPPGEYIWLHPFCWVGAFLWIGRCRPLRAFWSGWLIGAMANLAIFNWFLLLYPRRPMAVNLAMLLGYGLLSGLYLGIFAAGWQRVRRLFGAWWPVGMAAWFTACEFLYPQLFPYYQGCAWYRQTWIFPAVAVAGVSFMTFLIVLCNVLLTLVIETLLRTEHVPVRTWLRNGGVFVGCLAAACGWSAWQVHRLNRTMDDLPETRIALIQPTGPDPLYYLNRLQNLFRLTRAAVAADPSIQVAVWPESSIWNEAGQEEERLGQNLARELGIEIWTGAHFEVPRSDGPPDRFNSALRIDAAGRIAPRYDKCILAPFGESLPLSEYWPALDRLRGKPPVAHGRGPMVYDTPHGRMAFLICYEAVRYSFVRSVMQQQPDVLVVLSGDSWAKQSDCLPQHFMMAAVNAAQYGVPLVRCANRGVCGAVDAVGRVFGESDLPQSGVLVCSLHPCRASAPIIPLGNWFVGGCLAAFVAVVAGGLVRPVALRFRSACQRITRVLRRLSHHRSPDRLTVHPWSETNLRQGEYP